MFSAALFSDLQLYRNDPGYGPVPLNIMPVTKGHFFQSEPFSVGSSGDSSHKKQELHFASPSKGSCL